MAALRTKAESGQPWLFFREGIDWQWLSYRRVAARVAEAAQEADNEASREIFDVGTLIAHLVSVGPEDELEGRLSSSLWTRLETLARTCATEARPIVFAAPDLEILDDLAAVTLELGAAWAIEPMPEAFVATTRWVRPTILVAPRQALDALADAWDRSDARWSRLQDIVLWPPEAASADASVRRWRDVFGCRVMT